MALCTLIKIKREQSLSFADSPQKCGHKISDDLIEIQPGAVERMRQRLNHQPETRASNNHPFRVVPRAISLGLQSLRSIIASKPGADETGLPFQELSSPSTAPENSQPSFSPRNSIELLFLLICYSEGRYATKLL